MTIRSTARPLFALAALVATFAAGAATADDAPPGARLGIELNTARTGSEGCELSFLVTNTLPVAIDALVLEAVLFDTAGQVQQLTLFDFGALPSGRPRVRQFLVPGAACTGLGSILINGAQTCETGTLSVPCEDALDLRTRTDIELIG